MLPVCDKNTTQIDSLIDKRVEITETADKIVVSYGGTNMHHMGVPFNVHKLFHVNRARFCDLHPSHMSALTKSTF